jgi:hypothetical protein
VRQSVVKSPYDQIKVLLEEVMMQTREMASSVELAAFVMHVQNAVRQIAVVESAVEDVEKSQS